MSEIKGVTYPESISEISNSIEMQNYDDVSSIAQQYFLFTKNDDGYTYELRLYKNPKLIGDPHVESLYQVHLMVKKGSILNSETYGYIESE